MRRDLYRVAGPVTAGDAFRHMRGPLSWLVSIVPGLAGAVVGYLIFTVGLGIGDTAVFDWGGDHRFGDRVSGTAPQVA